MNDWSSFEDDKKLTDAWRKFLAEHEGELDEGWRERMSGLVGRGADWAQRKLSGGDGDGGDGGDGAPPEPTPAGPTPAPDPTVTEPVDAALPISASEIKIIQQMGKNKKGAQSNVFQIINRELSPSNRALGVALKNPRIAAIRNALFPELMKGVQNLYKRANIDIAESLLYELNDPRGTPALTAAQKGDLKKKARLAGGMAYFVPRGGKPPMFIASLRRKLEYHLLQRVNAQSLKLAIEQVASRERNPENKKQLLDGLRDPNRRLQVYKENVYVLIEEVVKIAEAALQKAVNANPDPRKAPPGLGRLPEHLSEEEREEYLERLVEQVINKMRGK